ncbi:DUF6268 family outer membrane beta-barrel protein [Christiangramia crocea]|uniref:DUF6268 family outer membrane beta-barrel protein n=1 Tax=Christiangramia crocea TaxID=2904124 RepID=A0A9X2A6D0_9FLAO|nr:DUF6268 family outer membrane beta-barrel protein [Gramella crocea]MCG9970891.1 DUF6268 family outer membrane beta-barrel protein [Gramella crocea]
MENRLLLILVLGIGGKSFSQTNFQTMGWQYSLYPSGEQYTTVSKTELFANFSRQFEEFSLDHALRLEMDLVELPIQYWTRGSRDVYIYDFSYAVGLNYSFSKNIAFHVEFEPSVTSTFENDFSSEDVVLYGGAYALISRQIAAKPAYLKIGIAYSSHLGEPEMLPLLAFSAMISKKLTVQLGFPKSEITYRFRPSGVLSAGLSYEGKYVNLGSSLLQEGNDHAEKLKWEWTSLGMNYSHDLSTLLAIELGAGYLLKNEFSLRNEEGEAFSTIKLNPYPFLSSGIKLKFK